MPNGSDRRSEISLLVRYGFLLAMTLPLVACGSSGTPLQTPEATSIPRWIEYENALASALIPNPFPPGKGLCEWDIWGHTKQEVYIWALCQVDSSDQGTAGSAPAVVRLASGGKIEQVVIPRDGVDYPKDIERLFPSDVQARIYASAFDTDAAMKHIALRRKNPQVPPLIVEAGTPLP